jgi:hypothetical protein
MSLKGFRVVAFLSGAMGLLVALVATAQAIGRVAAPAGQAPAETALVPVALSFIAIGALAGMALSTFKAQAEQIARLERRLSAE